MPGPSASRVIVWSGQNVQWKLYPEFGSPEPSPVVTPWKIPADAFGRDANHENPDSLMDDQALFMETPAGIVVILGCAHAGVINTLDYIAELTGHSQFHAVIGGMHLVNARQERIQATLDHLRKYDVQVIGANHCTGPKAMGALWSELVDSLCRCPALAPDSNSATLPLPHKSTVDLESVMRSFLSNEAIARLTEEDVPYLDLTTFSLGIAQQPRSPGVLHPTPDGNLRHGRGGAGHRNLRCRGADCRCQWNCPRCPGVNPERYGHRRSSAYRLESGPQLDGILPPALRREPLTL